MRMHWLFVMAFVGGPASASAQALTVFADLPLRLNLGDEVTVDARDGDSFAGHVVRMTADQIAVAGADARQRVFAATDVQRVRRRGDRHRGLQRRRLLARLRLDRDLQGLLQRRRLQAAVKRAVPFTVDCRACRR